MPVPNPYPSLTLSEVAAFMGFIKYYDVNDGKPAGDLTPHWVTYNEGNIEMIYNVTAANKPVVQPVATDPNLAKRCRYVVMTKHHSQEAQTSCDSFWESNAASIPY